MILSIIFLIIGFLLLLKGADWLIEGACSAAKRAGISQLIVALTLISFGTSTPELFINFASRLAGDTDITLGDILGSNIANILLILGLVACVRPLAFRNSTVIWEIPFALAMAVILFFLAKDSMTAEREFSGLSSADGFILLICFFLFLFYVYRLKKIDAGHEEGLPIHTCSNRKAIFMILAGILGLAIGAKGVVIGGMTFAEALGVRESVVALTLVAIGSSLPELVTSLVAVIKKRSDVAVGNIVGANIFNTCWILGISAVIRPLEIPGEYIFDICVVIAASLLLFGAVFFGKRGVLTKANGVFFIAAYGAYLVFLARRA